MKGSVFLTGLVLAEHSDLRESHDHVFDFTVRVDYMYVTVMSLLVSGSESLSLNINWVDS